MHIGRLLFWYYFILVVLIFGALSLGDFSATNFSERLIILSFLFLLLIAPFIFISRGRLIVKPISEELKQLRTLRESKEKLEARAKELEDKDHELILANERLVELNRAKSEFISLATHQLRTPLTALRWGVKMLLKGDLGETTEEQRKILRQSYETAGRAILTVNNFLNLDRIEGHKLDYQFVPVQFSQLLDPVLSEFEHRVKEKGLTLEVVKPPEPLPEIEADPIKLAMVLENLLDNAIKYTPAGGHVRFELKPPADGQVKILVADTGIGIPESDKERVFLRFGRARNVVQMANEGVGLGLFIAKEIAERHGGKLWFESKEGEGTTFYLTVPLRRPKL